jgi:preprotein translocase subunit YajC
MLAEGEGSIGIIIFLVAIFALMYLFMIRPRRKQQKEQEEMMRELRKGDKVITAGGIYGQIESVSQDTVVLKIESGATIRVARTSVIGKQGAEQKVEKKTGPFM